MKNSSFARSLPEKAHYSCAYVLSGSTHVVGEEHYSVLLLALSRRKERACFLINGAGKSTLEKEASR